MNYSTDQIVAFMESEKHVLGIPEWVQQSPKSPIYSLQIQVRSKAYPDIHSKLVATAKKYSKDQCGTFALVAGGSVVERMNYMPESDHSNPPDKRLPSELRSQQLLAGKSRYYSWNDNNLSGFPPPRNHINVARYLENDLQSYQEALQFFLQSVNLNMEYLPMEFEGRLI